MVGAEGERTGTTQIGILGPLGVRADGRDVVVAGHRRRALLGRLALAPGSPVEAERLADDLWGDDVGRRSVPTLRTYVTKLRAVLPDGAAVLRGTRGGYVLDVPAEDVDAWAFEASLRTPVGDPAAVEQALLPALDLWRGSALEEFADAEWARVQASRLDELRLVAHERLLDAQLALGRHSALVPTLESLVAAHPLREQFHVQLVLALYRSGRQADALAAQRRARALLASELGLDPTPELAGLEQRILVHDSTLSAPTTATPAVAVLSRRRDVLPAALQPRNSDPAFVGRSPELAGLRRSLGLAVEDGARLVVLRGDAGIGKTTLAGRFAADTGPPVLHGHCDEGLAAPYAPYTDALRAVAAGAPDDTLAATLGPDSGALAALAPELAAHLPVGASIWGSDHPGAEQQRLFDAVAAWFAHTARHGRLVVVLDDLQWAAPSTLALTGHLVRSLRRAPVLFLATVRPPAPLVDDLVGELHRMRAVDVVALSGLGQPDSDALVAAEAPPGALDASSAGELWEATGGNPYLLTEMARHGLRRDDAPPASIVDVLAARVRRLGDDAADVLGTAAAAGSRFDLPTLAAALGRNEDEVLDVLDRAAAAGVVAELDGAGGGYAFAHAILHAAVAALAGANRQAARHRRLAAALEAAVERRPARAAELADDIARHWTAAGGEHADAAARWFAEAGRSALRRHAYAEAAERLERALATSPSWRATALLDLGTARAKAGDADRAREAFVEAAALGRAANDPRTVALAAVGSSTGGRGVSGWVVDVARIALLQEAEQSLPASEVALRVRVQGELALALHRPEERARRQALATAATEAAASDGRPEVAAAALPANRVRHWHPRDTPTRLAATEDALRVGEEAGDPWLVTDALAWIAGDRLELGDRAGVDRVAARCRELADQLGGVLVPWRADVLAVQSALLDGDLAESERLADAAFARWGDSASPDAVQTYGFQLAMIRTLQGRFDDTVALATVALERWPTAIGLRAPLALGLAGTGRLHEAGAIVASCAAGGLDGLPHDSGWLTAAATLAEAAGAVGDRSVAAALTEALAELPDRFATLAGPGVFWGSVSHQLGWLALTCGRPDDAVAHLRRACELEEGLGALPWAARSWVRLSWACEATGDGPAAGRASERGMELTSRCGIDVPLAPPARRTSTTR